jgi:hypothetical protein
LRLVSATTPNRLLAPVLLDEMRGVALASLFGSSTGDTARRADLSAGALTLVAALALVFAAAAAAVAALAPARTAAGGDATARAEGAAAAGTGVAECTLRIACAINDLLAVPSYASL